MGVSMCVCARLCLCLCLRVCLCACVFMFVSLNVYAKVCGIAHEAGSYKYTPCVYIYVHAYSACANTTPIFLWVKHAFPRAAGICWTRIIEWECQGRTRIIFFPSFIQSLCGLHWVTTDFPFQLRMVAQDYPWLSTKRGTQASELPASGPCQVQAGLPATAL